MMTMTLLLLRNVDRCYCYRSLNYFTEVSMTWRQKLLICQDHKHVEYTLKSQSVSTLTQ